MAALTERPRALKTDRSIPFYNLILRCDRYEKGKKILLPDGYAFASFRPGYASAWARLECEEGDFSSPAEAYFRAAYMTDPAVLGERAVFALDRTGEVVGSCIAWRDRRDDGDAASLHWLIVAEKHRGIGLGRALCRRTMEIFARRGEMPVYIHTQPWSWRAVLLYLSLGFRLQKSDTFSHYENQYEEAVRTLRAVLPPDAEARLGATLQQLTDE